MIFQYYFTHTNQTLPNIHKRQYKIGVFGLGIELKNLFDTKLYKETKYLNPIDITQDMIRVLKKEEKCDLIIFLCI